MKKSVLFALCAVLSSTVFAADTEAKQEKKVAESSELNMIIQAGAFTNPDLADAQAGRLSLLGVPATVVETKNQQGTLVRVVRSQKMAQKEAEKVAERLIEHNLPVMLLLLDNKEK